jgi:Translation initiation factor IF-2, N-terminal region
MRVHELAAELGWTPRQLLAELASHGEFVKSAASTLEAPIVRAIRSEFAPAVAKPELDNAGASELYGCSVDSAAKDDPDESFEEALARIKSRGKASKPGSGQSKWRPPVLEALLEEVTAQHGSNPSPRDLKEARYLHPQRAEACIAVWTTTISR